MNEDKERLYSIYLYEKLNLIFDIPDNEDNKEENIESDYPQIVQAGKFPDSKFHLVDKDGNIISNDYRMMGSFHDGYALVRSHEWNFINEKGELLCEKGFDLADDFVNGIARVKTSAGYNFINTKGKRIFEKGLSYTERLKNGCFLVFYNGDANSRINIVGPNGVLASEKGFLKVDDNRKSNIIRLKNKKWNVYDTREGRLLCNNEYDDIACYDKFIVVEDNGKYAFVSRKTGDLLTGIWYDKVTCLDDLFIVYQNGKCNIVGEDGVELCQDWYKAIYGSLDTKMLMVQRNDRKYNYVDYSGNLISDEWYSDAQAFEHGFAAVSERKMGVKFWNHIDINGNLISDWAHEKLTIASYDENVAFFKRYGKKFYRNRMPRDFGKYKIKKKGSSFQCISDDDKFKINYEPIHIYGNRYVVCNNEEHIYLYDRKYDSYKELYNYDENYISNFTKDFIFYYGKVYLMYNNKMIDVTYFYDNKLKDKTFKINEGIDIMADDEFYDGDMEIIRQRYEKVLKEIDEYKKEQQRKEEQKRIEELTIKQEAEKQELNERKKESIKQLNTAIQKLEEYEKKAEVIETNRFHVENLLVECGDHKEINPICFEVGLKRVDFSFMALKNVKLSGLDLSGTNISFSTNDPQEIYNKDLSNCNLTGVVFLPGTIFDGVHIEGSSFTTDGNERTMDLSEESFRNAYYDENTTLNGIPLVELLKEEKHNRR